LCKISSIFQHLWENRPNHLFFLKCADIKVFNSFRAPICGAAISKQASH